MPDTPNSADARREAEMNLGKQRTHEALKNLKVDDRELKRLQQANREQLEEDEQRRADVAGESLADKAERDRAGAEVIDQAQTQLEAVGHLKDREEKVLSYDQQRAVEELDGTDNKGAEAITTDLTTAQAVNQPTVLAANAGQDTENQPLNTTRG